MLQKGGQIEQQVQVIGYEGVCVCVCVCVSVCGSHNSSGSRDKCMTSCSIYRMIMACAMPKIIKIGLFEQGISTHT
jgi:hypothetical protein